MLSVITCNGEICPSLLPSDSTTKIQERAKCLSIIYRLVRDDGELVIAEIFSFEQLIDDGTINSD